MWTKKNLGAFTPCFVAGLMLWLTACKPAGPKAFEDGQRLLEKGRPAEAAARLRVAAEIFRTNAAAWNYLGIACHQAGQTSNAVVAYRRALNISPDLMEARLNLGMLFLELDQTGEARSAFTVYTLGRPNAAEGFERLAETEMRMKDFPQAELHIRKALQLDEKSADAWNTLGLIQIQRGRSREAVQSFNAALARQSDFPPALLNLAIVTQQLGDRAGALKLYRRYVALKPRPADAEAVAGVVGQLEAELAPPRSAVPILPTPTPPVVTKPAVTNPVPKPATTVPLKAEVAQPKPPATPAPQPAPVSAPTPTPAQPRPAPTVVTLPPEPVIRSAPKPAESVAAAPAPAVEKVEVAAATPLNPTTATPEKKPFLQSINPVNLFRHSKPAVTPLPVKETAPASSPGELSSPTPSTSPKAAATAQVSAAPSAITSPPAPPLSSDNAGDFPRYKYLGGGRVAPGDRAAAQRFAEKGVQAMTSQRYLEATTAFRAAVEADPSWFQAQLNFAAAALQADRVTESLFASETALALQPGSVAARYNFALALKRGNYVFDAATELEKILAANPGEADAHLMLGNLCAETLRQPAKARAHYLKVLELNPKHPRATAIRFWLKAHP